MTNEELSVVMKEQLKIAKITARLTTVLIKLLLEIHQDKLKDKAWHKIDNLVTEIDQEIG